MGILDWIIKIGAVLGALGVIIGVAIKIWNKINAIIKSTFCLYFILSTIILYYYVSVFKTFTNRRYIC